MATVERYMPLFRAVEVACDAPDFDCMPSSPGTHAKAPPPVTLLLQWIKRPGLKGAGLFCECGGVESGHARGSSAAVGNDGWGPSGWSFLFTKAGVATGPHLLTPEGW